jgi:hypothetical protein
MIRFFFFNLVHNLPPYSTHGGNIVLSWSDTTFLLLLVGVLKSVQAVLEV